jgi:uncharacterized protein (TIGR00730 family)
MFMPCNEKTDIVKGKKLKAPHEDVWRIFKIMSEFVEGFEVLSNLQPSIVIFGSARTPKESKYYKLAEATARTLAEKGFGIATGGGPGIMEAANKGASECGGSSAGINIHLPFETSSNEFIDKDKLLQLRYFFVRKVLLTKYAQGFVIMPGGFGTIDEFSEVLTLIQTGKTKLSPVVLMGTEYWGGLIDWIKNTALAQNYINTEDLNLFSLTDDPDEVADIICKFHSGKEFEPNF